MQKVLHQVLAFGQSIRLVMPATGAADVQFDDEGFGQSQTSQMPFERWIGFSNP